MDSNPKRRKYKDNPYTIKNIDNKYYVFINDEEVEVTKEVYDVFNEYELIDIKQMNEYDRHIEHLEYTEDKLSKRTSKLREDIFNEIDLKILNDYLYEAIDTLTDIQKRRLKEYYFNHRTLRDIASEEAISFQCVDKSIKKAIKNIKKYLKKFYK